MKPCMICGHDKLIIKVDGDISANAYGGSLAHIPLVVWIECAECFATDDATGWHFDDSQGLWPGALVPVVKPPDSNITPTTAKGNYPKRDRRNRSE